MATVTALVTRVCEDLGLNSTAASADRARALEWLNWANRVAVRRSGAGVTTFTGTLPASLTGEYSIATDLAIPRFIRFHYLRSGSDRLAHRSVESITDVRNGGFSGDSVLSYAITGLDDLSIYPIPSGATTLTGVVEQAPLALVESGAVGGVSETTPTAIPETMHEEVLVSGACARGARFLRKLDRAQVFDSWYDAAVAELGEMIRGSEGDWTQIPVGDSHPGFAPAADTYGSGM